jgi:RHS repeat-associated protein
MCVSNVALTAENAYDILDRVTNMVYRNDSATVVGSFAYRCDVRGLVTQKAGTLDGATATNTYAYDALGRLISADGVAYTYDLAGNRLTAGASSFTYSNNRLACVAHDTAGNITNMMRGGVTLTLSWNTLGQFVSVATNGTFAESYAYDPLGRRVKTTSGGTTVYHVYDGSQCAADLDASGNPIRSYTWGQGIDNLLAITVYADGATNSYYAVKDHLGSVQALVNASGAVVESYTYDAWGTVLGGQQSAIGNRYLWQGREYSHVTGLYNFRARWYVPTFGRWLSKDPIGLEGGLNLFVFCGDDPVNFRDPMGLCKKWADEAGLIVDNAIAISSLWEAMSGGLLGGSGANVDQDRRYIDTDRLGMIDLQHVTSAAIGPPGAPTVLGLAVEINQMMHDQDSAFKKEDLVSNVLGGVAKDNARKRGTSIGKQVAIIIENAGPKGNPNYAHD